jgi:hypothetical protein
MDSQEDPDFPAGLLPESIPVPGTCRAAQVEAAPPGRKIRYMGCMKVGIE